MEHEETKKRRCLSVGILRAFVSSCSIRILLTLTLSVLVWSTDATSAVIPKAQAAHFCRLFIHDGETVAPLSLHARRLMTSGDSLTAEQMFATYIFHHDNWQTLRLFPHEAADGTVRWYAPADELPEAIGTEHQKYIREVLPRLQREIEAGNWQTVDAYIDRMLQYQCQFGSKSDTPGAASRRTFPSVVITLILLLTAVFVMVNRKKRAKRA